MLASQALPYARLGKARRADAGFGLHAVRARHLPSICDVHSLTVARHLVTSHRSLNRCEVLPFLLPARVVQLAAKRSCSERPIGHPHVLTTASSHRLICVMLPRTEGFIVHAVAAPRGYATRSSTVNSSSSAGVRPDSDPCDSSPPEPEPLSMAQSDRSGCSPGSTLTLQEFYSAQYV
jgi:hypothetical protein